MPGCWYQVWKMGSSLPRRGSRKLDIVLQGMEGKNFLTVCTTEQFDYACVSDCQQGWLGKF
jgi:hypothetical protein